MKIFVLLFIINLDSVYLETDELLYLDPHVTQAHADTNTIPDDTSYHCDRVN